MSDCHSVCEAGSVLIINVEYRNSGGTVGQ